MTREDINEIIALVCPNDEDYEKPCISPKYLRQELEQLALEQEPRKGHWDIKDTMWWVCSACGCQTRMIKKYNVPNFCPACGADMREGEV